MPASSRVIFVTSARSWNEPASLELPLLGLAHSGDHDALAEHSPRLAQVGRGLAHPSPPSVSDNRPITAVGGRQPRGDRRQRRAEGRAGWPARTGTLPAPRATRQGCYVALLPGKRGFSTRLWAARPRARGPGPLVASSPSRREKRRRSRCLLRPELRPRDRRLPPDLPRPRQRLGGHQHRGPHGLLRPGHPRGARLRDRQVQRLLQGPRHRGRRVRGELPAKWVPANLEEEMDFDAEAITSGVRIAEFY